MNGVFNESQLNAIEGGITGFRFSAASGNSTFGALFGGTLGLNAIIFFIAGFALMIYLIIGGFQMMTSGGNPDGVSDGKSKITSALIGFVIIFTAFWVVQILGNVLGLQGIITTFGA